MQDKIEDLENDNKSLWAIAQSSSKPSWLSSPSKKEDISALASKYRELQEENTALKTELSKDVKFIELQQLYNQIFNFLVSWGSENLDNISVNSTQGRIAQTLFQKNLMAEIPKMVASEESTILKTQL